MAPDSTEVFRLYVTWCYVYKASLKPISDKTLFIGNLIAETCAKGTKRNLLTSLLERIEIAKAFKASWRAENLDAALTNALKEKNK